MSHNKQGDNVKIYRNVTIRNSQIGDNVIIGDDSFISGCNIGDNLIIERRSLLFNSHIGEYSTIGWNSVVRDAKVGRYCSIAWNCSIGGAEHYYDRITSSFFPIDKSYGVVNENHEDLAAVYSKPINVGNDVWLAAGVQVLRGVSIGDGAVVGGGGIVTKNIPPYEIWAGVPAKKIGQRFSDEIIAELLELKWWNLPVEFISKNIDVFRKPVDLELLKELKSLVKNN